MRAVQAQRAEMVPGTSIIGFIGQVLQVGEHAMSALKLSVSPPRAVTVFTAKRQPFCTTTVN